MDRPKNVCVDCGVEVEVGDDVSCAETECSTCGKKMTDKPVERTKESKSPSEMTANEIRASDTLSPEEKKKLLNERLRKLVLE